MENQKNKVTAHLLDNMFELIEHRSICEYKYVIWKDKTIANLKSNEL